MRKRKKIILIVLLLCTYFTAHLLIEPYLLKIKRYTIVDAELPEAFDGMRVVQLTDIHHGPYFSKERVREVVQMTNDLKPDIIVLTGDYVEKDAKYAPGVIAELKNLKAPEGVFAVLGNHEEGENHQKTLVELQKTNIQLLKDRNVTLRRGDDSIQLAGISYWRNWVGKSAAFFKKWNPKMFTILLAHNPDYADNLYSFKEAGKLVDLMFCGHTHGGQVTLFGLWAPILTTKTGNKYLYGEYDLPAGKMIVSSGVGTNNLPIRFWARPEIVEVTLKKK